MKLRLHIVTLGLLLIAGPALADSTQPFVWNLNVTSAVDEALSADNACAPNPYALYRRGCSGDELNVNLERSNTQHLSVLDRLALFVYRYKDLNLDTQLQSHAKLKFTMGLANFYEQEAKARVELRIWF